MNITDLPHKLINSFMWLNGFRESASTSWDQRVPPEDELDKLSTVTEAVALYGKALEQIGDFITHVASPLVYDSPLSMLFNMVADGYYTGDVIGDMSPHRQLLRQRHAALLNPQDPTTQVDHDALDAGMALRNIATYLEDAIYADDWVVDWMLNDRLKWRALTNAVLNKEDWLNNNSFMRSSVFGFSAITDHTNPMSTSKLTDNRDGLCWKWFTDNLDRLTAHDGILKMLPDYVLETRSALALSVLLSQRPGSSARTISEADLSVHASTDLVVLPGASIPGTEIDNQHRFLVGYASRRPVSVQRNVCGLYSSPSGPAIRYEDGYAVYALHGHFINPRIGRRDRDLTLSVFSECQSPGEFEASVEYYGWHRYLRLMFPNENPADVIKRGIHIVSPFNDRYSVSADFNEAGETDGTSVKAVCLTEGGNLIKTARKL